MTMALSRMTTPTPSNPVNAVADLTGGTPLLEIEYTLDGRPGRVYAKYEIENMTGSVKDRMAAHILRRGYEAGTLRAGDTIVEASSGNTGISFAAVGSALDRPSCRRHQPDRIPTHRWEIRWPRTIPRRAP